MRRILCKILGHKYYITGTDKVVYGLYDIRFTCVRCGLNAYRSVRAKKFDEADFWEMRVRKQNDKSNRALSRML